MFGKFLAMFHDTIQIEISQAMIFQRNESFQGALVQISDYLPVIISCLATSLIYFLLDLCYFPLSHAAVKVLEGKLYYMYSLRCIKQSEGFN